MANKVTTRHYERNKLKSSNRPMCARIPPYRQILTHAQRAVRVHWFQRHLRLMCSDWNAILFSDESRFNLSNLNKADGHVRIYRRRGERFVDACVLIIEWNNLTPPVI